MSPDIDEQDLPGIGRRFEMATADGVVTVIVHHSGRRDLYCTSERGDRVAVSMEDADARRLGAIIAGAYFQPAAVARVEAVVGGLLVDWVTLRRGGPADGRTIAELEIRRRTRMTVVAVLRGDETLLAPDADERLLGGDRVVVVGRPEDLDGLVALVNG